MRVRLEIVSLGAAVALSACAHQGGFVPGMMNPAANANQPMVATPATSATSVSRKLVAGKELPSTLVAQDRTRCTVPGVKYRGTGVGDNVWCDWRADNRAP